MPEVRPERTGWRDQGLSERHRLWGWDCPAVDIDFLLIEYNSNKCVAIIEYKNENATINTKSSSFHVLIDLANRSELPLFLVVYKNDFSSFSVIGLNDSALPLCNGHMVVDEEEYVNFLYSIRGMQAPSNVLELIARGGI